MLSVIVPVYNVEKYLRRCLDSLVNQTYQDIEIICVNDGSTDSCPKILDEYCAKYPKIIVSNKPNGGLSSARNFGLLRSNGEYIAFIDSDDWVDLNYYEKLMGAIINHGADAAFTSYIRKGEKKHKVRIPIEDEKVYKNINRKIDISDSLKNPCVWNKVYKKDILIKNKLLFEEGKYYEDAMFTMPFLNLCDKLVSVPNVYYYYYVNPSSIVKSGKTQQKIADRMTARLGLLKYLNENKIFIKPKQLLTCQYKIQLFGLTLWVKKQDQYMDKYYLFGSIPLYTKYLNNASIVELRGRMANQMFVWAFAKKLQKETGLPVFIDDSATTPKIQPLKCFENYKDKTVPKNPVKMFLRKIIPFRK
jgi:glycosyltransferase involved in cell wall biosynthesis